MFAQKTGNRFGMEIFSLKIEWVDFKKIEMEINLNELASVDMQSGSRQQLKWFFIFCYEAVLRKDTWSLLRHVVASFIAVADPGFLVGGASTS